MTVEDVAGKGQWLTFAQIATLTGKTVPAAQQLVRRRKWRKRPSNRYHGPSRFLVPAEVIVGYASAPVAYEESAPEESDDRIETLLGRAWDALFAEGKSQRKRIRELETKLSNVRQNVERLEAQAAERAAWGLRQRLAWAVRPSTHTGDGERPGTEPRPLDRHQRAARGADLDGADGQVFEH
jgi:hypothetical protein